MKEKELLQIIKDNDILESLIIDFSKGDWKFSGQIENGECIEYNFKKI